MLGAELLFVLAQGRDLWATQDPSRWGLLLGAAVAVIAAAAVYRALCREEDALPVSALPPEVAGVNAARRGVDESLAAAPPALRAALRPLLEDPLRALDRRVGALSADASRPLPPRSGQDPEREALREALAREDEPRARALLEATLDDLDRAHRLRQDQVTQTRLARLELRRLQGLLAALPARVESLRHAHRLDPDGAEAIARQLELAVAHSQDVLSPGATD